MDSDKRKLEDKATITCFALSLAGLLGGLYAYTLGKKAGELTLSSEGAAYLPADGPSEVADDSPDPAGDE